MNGSPKYIHIYLNRDSKFENSDYLEIIPFNDMKEFSINYTIAPCASSKKQKIHYNFVLERGELLGYVDTLLTFVKYDSAPFNEIQFDIPGFPTILVKYEHIQDMKQIILDSIRLLLKTQVSWPRAPVEITKVESRYIDEIDSDSESYVCL
jgi:hypothetical protein